MNYFNTTQFDDDYWLSKISEKIKAIKDKKYSNFHVTSEFTDSGVTVSSDKTSEEMAAFALGLMPPKVPGTKSEKVNKPQFSYFLTVAFPTKHYFKIKHVEIRSQGQQRIVFGPIKYGDCTQSEQHIWLLYILNKNIKLICDHYDIFFEQTKEGNLHLHGRLGYTDKKISKKDVKSLIHRMFDCPTKYKQFVDIKDYDDKRWNEYDQKKKKTYQTLDYPHFKNI